VALDSPDAPQPQRIEVITSFYKHPNEVLLNSALSSAILYLVVGVGSQAAAGAVLLSGLAELVYHWNVRTPYWLGFIFQRRKATVCITRKAFTHSIILTSRFGTCFLAPFAIPAYGTQSVASRPSKNSALLKCL